MGIALNHRVEALIRRKMDEGRYATESDVVEEAMQALEDRDKRRRLQPLLQRAIDQAERGEVFANTPDFWSEIEHEVEERVAHGDVPRPEVCP